MAAKRKSPHEPSRCSERLQVVKALKVSEREAAEKSGVSKRKRFHRPKQRAKCKLLKLPGEIRNLIYRYAIVEPERIQVTPKGPGEPSLLRVCKGIRNEARSIYYIENKFQLKVVDYKGAVFAPFSRQYMWYSHMTKAKDLTFMMTGRRDWDNLVEWAKSCRFWSGNLTPEFVPCETPDDFFMDGVFKLAATLNCSGAVVTDKALNAMRQTLRGTFSGWTSYDEDED